MWVGTNLIIIKVVSMYFHCKTFDLYCDNPILNLKTETFILLVLSWNHLMTFQWLPSHSYFKFWWDWCQLSIHQTTLTVTTLTFISVQARPGSVVPQTIPLWPLLQLCISIPGQTGVSCPPNRFRCEDSVRCLPITMLCNGVVDCPDRSDEGAFCRKFMILIQNLNAFCRLCKMELCL